MANEGVFCGDKRYLTLMFLLAPVFLVVGLFSKEKSE